MHKITEYGKVVAMSNFPCDPMSIVEAFLGDLDLHFDPVEGDSSHLRMTAVGAYSLLPRLARHCLSLPNPAPRSLVRSTLNELAQAERAAGVSRIDGLLARTDLSTVQREVLESLADWHRQSKATPAPRAEAHSEPRAAVVDLASWRAAKQTSV